MKALCYHGTEDVRVESVPDPQLINPRDVILKVTATAICGSDLHIFGGYIPTMARGDILGHEFMGEVVEAGTEVRTLRVGDRVVVPFTIACGRSRFCKDELWSLCDNSKGLTLKMGQTHVHRYLQPLLQRIASGQIDPSFIVTHRVRLDEGPEMYRTFRDKAHECIKVVMRPDGATRH